VDAEKGGQGYWRACVHFSTLPRSLSPRVKWVMASGSELKCKGSHGNKGMKKDAVPYPDIDF